MSWYAKWSEAVKEALQNAWTASGQPGVFPYNVSLTPNSTGFFLAEYTGAFELRKMTALYTRNVAGAPPQDYAMTTHHFLNLTGGAPDATWTTEDYELVEAAFDDFWEDLGGFYYTTTVLAGYRWQADGPAYKPFGSSLQPVLRNTARAIAGTSSTAALPPQVAITVTEVTEAKFTVLDVEGAGTQLRNRWGRFYMPAPITAASANGRVSDTTRTAIAANAGNFYNACAGADLWPVMYSPTTGHAWSVTELHVDDIFDVIRSRRFTTPLQRTVQLLAS